MTKNDMIVACLVRDARGRGLMANTGWTNEARVASLEVRRAKAALRKTRDVSPEQAAFEDRVQAELQDAKDKWDAYYRALSDEEKAAAQSKYPWLAKLNLRLGGSKVQRPEFPPVVPSPGANAKMYFDYLDAMAADKAKKRAKTD